MIQDYRYTRQILDDLENLPEMNAPWGSDWRKGDIVYRKNHEIQPPIEE